MAQFLKCTMLIQVATVKPDGTPGRIGGFSESVYNDTLGTEGINQFLKLCEKRAAMLPKFAAVVGQRYQVVNPKGASSTGSARYAGRFDEDADMPQMALYARIGSSGVTNLRPLYLRGMPDEMVKRGEYSPTPGFVTAVANYFNEITGFYFKGRDLTLSPAKISTIAEDGTFVLNTPLTFDVNSVVQISRTNLPFGGQQGAIAYVQTKTDSTHGKLYAANWPYGITKGGSMRIFAEQFFVMQGNTAKIKGSVVKKVGRPFDQFRGRASART